MSDSIVGAMIAAGASVAVALINANAQRVKRTDTLSDKTIVPGNENKTLIMNGHKKIWVTVILISVPWIILSPFFLGHDFAGMNMFIIGGVIFFLSILKPINPLTPFTLSIALGLLASLMEPITKYIKFHQSIDIFGPDTHWNVILGVVIGVALINGTIDYFRLKQFK
jgi:uncharacterized membrane-anchored protein YitT (DUF2179 family)